MGEWIKLTTKAEIKAPLVLAKFRKTGYLSRMYAVHDQREAEWLRRDGWTHYYELPSPREVKNGRA